MDGLQRITQAIKESSADLKSTLNKPPYVKSNMPLVECFKVLQEAQQGIKNARQHYSDPHGALDEAYDLIGDALTDIQAVIAADSGGCTCAQCEDENQNVQNEVKP